MPKFEAFKPKGKTNKEVLESLLSEASAICGKFDTLAVRHTDDIARYRKDNQRNTLGKDLESWIKVSTFKRLFGIAEPEKFSYEFHELRRAFFEAIDREGSFNEGEIFISLCQISGIRPLYSSIVNANQTMDTLYEGVVDARSIPVIDVFMFEMMEFDVIILRLFVDANNFYGIDKFLLILGA